MPVINSSFRSFLTENENDSIILKPTNIVELEEICKTFKSGYDNMPMHVIKRSFSLILEPLMHFINLSFAMSIENGLFPSKLKTAKIVYTTSFALVKTIQTRGYY